MECCSGSDGDAVAVVEDEAFDTAPLIDETVDAIGVLNDPGAILPTDFGV
jgi:hypothetical protein